MNELHNPSPITNIAKGTRIKADVETDSIIQVAGRVEGDITTKSHLVLEKTGHITGSVICKKATIKGKITGELRVTEQLEIKNTANLDGFVFTKNIRVEEGAILIGIIKAGPKIDVLNSKISGQNVSKVKNQQIDTETISEPKESTHKEKEPERQQPENRFLTKLLIGIPGIMESNDNTEQLYSASQGFLQALDFNLEIFDAPSFSPYYQNLAFVIKGTEEQAEVARHFKKAKETLETAFLKKEAPPEASNLQKVTIELTNVLSDFEQVAILLGEILFIKFQSGDVQTIAVEIINGELMDQLKKKPKLITDPEKLYSLL
ncbi:MAG: polymer-forming cytoskeletal protein [Gracilimonas sp.]